MRKLPVDISTFSELRNLNYLYVDKTEHMYNMITGGRRYFLSRPRRFGKSLLVSTLKQILLGNKELFEGLWISSSDYQWREHGVITIDFSVLRADSLDIFKKRLLEELMVIAESYEIIMSKDIDDPDLCFKRLVYALFQRFGRVAVLIDEYDSQILKALHNHDVALSIRNEIQQFFTVIKSLDEQIQFVFITGVSSFVKAGLFSGINNLQIITLDKQFSGICGYTDQEIDHYFVDYIANWSNATRETYDELRYKIKTWYNGYRFGYNVATVYNPFSLMNALQRQQFKNFWFQSGTPSFLIEILKKEYKNFDPERLRITENGLGVFDIGTIPVVSLMFQTGYLTIVDYNEDLEQYTLDYPNVEVKKSFQKYLLEVFARIESTVADDLSQELRIAFNEQHIVQAVELIQKLFAHVPYQLHMKEEKFYHSLLIMVFITANMNAQAEISTSHGRIDLVLDLLQVVYVIEIKFNSSPEEALNQIEERRYYERFQLQKKAIILLGLSFNRKPHNFTVTYAMKKL